MIYFTPPTSNPAYHEAMRRGELGYIDTPGQGNDRAAVAPLVWCADNGAFGQGWPGEDKWLGWLRRNAHDAPSCAFATAPDAVCDHQRTYRRSDRFLGAIRDLGYPAAFVIQNGATLRRGSIPWDRLDVIFIGGDDAFKLGRMAAAITAEAITRGKYVHMGRVSGLGRHRYAQSIGCSSTDGTLAKFGPDVNLPRVMRLTRDEALTPVLF